MTRKIYDFSKPEDIEDQVDIEDYDESETENHRR